MFMCPPGFDSWVSRWSSIRLRTTRASVWAVRGGATRARPSRPPVTTLWKTAPSVCMVTSQCVLVESYAADRRVPLRQDACRLPLRQGHVLQTEAVAPEGLRRARGGRGVGCAHGELDLARDVADRGRLPRG